VNRALVVAIALGLGATAALPQGASLGPPEKVEAFGFALRPPAGWQMVPVGVGSPEVKHYKHPQELGRVVVWAYVAPSLEFGRYMGMKMVQDFLRKAGATYQTVAASRPLQVGGHPAFSDQVAVRVPQIPVPIGGEALFVGCGPYVLLLLGAWAEQIGPGPTVQASLRSLSFLADPNADEQRPEKAQGLTLKVPVQWQLRPDKDDPTASDIVPPAKLEAEMCGLALKRATWKDVASVGVTAADFGTDARGALDKVVDALRDQQAKKLAETLAEHKKQYPTEPLFTGAGTLKEIKRDDLAVGGATGRLAQFTVPLIYSDLKAEVKFRLICGALARGEDVWVIWGACPEEWTEPHLSALTEMIASLAPEGAAAVAEAPKSDDKAAAPVAPTAPAASPPAQPDADQVAEARKHCAAALEHKKAKRWAEALAELGTALELWPDCADAHWLAGWCQIGIGERRKAVPHFKRVIELEPGTSRATEAHKAIDAIQAGAQAPAATAGSFAETVQVVVVPAAGIYHRPGCKMVQAAPAEAIQRCHSGREALEAGARIPCSLCRPGPLSEPLPTGLTQAAAEFAAGPLPLAGTAELQQAIQCRGVTQDGARCRNRTRNPNGFCHYHQDQAPRTTSLGR
jgi:tetratricopeptide (TPR) repeat protein